MSDIELDRAVADALGISVGMCLAGYLAQSESIKFHPYSARRYSPSTDWGQGGPILEDYAICVRAISDASWQAVEQITHCSATGKTYLIAAMRCFVEAHRATLHVDAATISAKCPDSGHLISQERIAE